MSLELPSIRGSDSLEKTFPFPSSEQFKNSNAAFDVSLGAEDIANQSTY